MEQMTKVGRFYMYGSRKCRNADAAYVAFRADCIAEAGRDTSKYPDRIGRRKERVHGFGFVRESDAPLNIELDKRIPCRTLGLVCLSYCRIVGAWDFPKTETDSDAEQLVERMFTKGSGMLCFPGRKEHAGRTSRRLGVKYR